MSGAFAVGAVLHWTAFDKERPEGAEIKNKFLVVIGAKAGMNALMILATRQRHRKSHKAGCVAEEGYYLILGGGKDFFKDDTWLLLNEPKEASAAELVKKGMAREVETCGNLRDELVRAIINCLKRTEDVSDYHLSLC